MEKYICCYNLTEKCYYVAKDVSDDRALQKIEDHIERVHGIRMTEEMRERAVLLLREAA
jgi:predicted small metal-binding protein